MNLLARRGLKGCLCKSTMAYSQPQETHPVGDTHQLIPVTFASKNHGLDCKVKVQTKHFYIKDGVMKRRKKDGREKRIYSIR